MKAGLAGLTVLSFALQSPALAQDSAFSVRAWLRPRATLRSAVWSSSRTRDDRGPLAGGVVWADVAPPLSARIDLKAAGWLGVGALAGTHDVDARLRELYARIALGPADIRLGKQIIAWGRADALNPTDNLSPDDLTLLVPDDDDQKEGVPGALAALTTSGTTLTAVWLADFQGHTLPVGPVQTREPRNVAAQGAVRLERSGGRVDWSVSYFSGLDLLPDIDSAFVFSYHRLHVVGADAAVALGRYGVRAEAAWLGTEDRDGRDPEIKNPTFYAVVGADRTFGGYFNVNAQYVIRRVHDYMVPPDGGAAQLLARISQQLRPVQHGVTVRLSNQWWHETLAAEIAGLVWSPPWQISIRPRLTYAVTDAWHIHAGADFFDGQLGTLFHDLRPNSLAFLEVRRGL